MEIYTNSPLFKRLQTFLLTPLPNDVEFSISPLKLAEAGFVRSERSVSDEVECRYCGLKYSGWSKESPLAVHRTLNPNCPFLNTPPVSYSVKHSLNEQRNHRNELEKVTKQQFPTSESLSSSIFRVPDVEHPFTPKKGGYMMLFESHRLLTYRDPFSPDAAVYAEAGFMYDVASKSVFCVFCDAEMDFKPLNLSLLEEIHAEKFPLCPFAHCFEVGNISVDNERKIKEKDLTQYLCDALNKCNKVKYLIKHPEFDNKAARLGTFLSWPRMSTIAFPAEEMASCGFFYTGFNDKVKCYACGVGLYDWPPGAIPVEQHAKASPHCVFLLESKGREYVSTAQNAELVVAADQEEINSGLPEHDTALLVTDCTSSLLSSQSLFPDKMSPSSSPALPKQCRSSPSSPGSPVLDMEAIKAAMACQYTLEQIAPAITKFFILSCGRYPNKDLLLGTLKAADENYVKLCEKSQEIIHTKAELTVAKAEKNVFQAEKALFQAKEVQFQVKEAQFKAEKAAYQQEIQARCRQLQRDLIIQQHREDLERKDQSLKEKDQLLEQKDQMIEQNYYELDMKKKEVEDLQRHVRSLQAALESKQRTEKLEGGESALTPLLDHTICESESTTDEFPVASCKVCLVKRSQIMFRPCKHLCCCDTCAAQLLLLGQNCPICREPNQGFEKVYVI